MKYMGSKRHMLTNGLGKTIITESKNKNRFFDLFSGSAAVTWFAAQNTHGEVVSSDLQHYSSVLSLAVTSRTKRLVFRKLLKEWQRNASDLARSSHVYSLALEIQSKIDSVDGIVDIARILCSNNPEIGPVWYAYGGYYYSPLQAIQLDSLRKTIPSEEPFRSVALASLISAASDCAASPGHTAQPLQPTTSGIKHVQAAWKKEPFLYLRNSMEEVSQYKSNKKGIAIIGDAYEVAKQATSSDLVFIDPPYSDVHYSRFYHVLETISKGYCGEVSGSGRYPPAIERPTSNYSRKGQAHHEFSKLIETIATQRANAIITYPDGNCSNNLSGQDILNITENHYSVDYYIVERKFSTLGGTKLGSRPARQLAREMVIVAKSK